jgi:transposase
LCSSTATGLAAGDAPSAYGPHKTLYNRWKRWGAASVFKCMMEGSTTASAEPQTVMIDATYLRRTARPRACGLKGDFGRMIGRTKGGMNTKLHAFADANGRPLSFFMSAG